MSPVDRVVVDWRISEYELVDDNEASHVDKPVVLLPEFYTNVVICVHIILLLTTAALSSCLFHSWLWGQVTALIRSR